MSNISVFAQIISRIPSTVFHQIVTHHQSDKHSKGIGTWEHLVAMLFCQFGQARSLRDICHGLRAAEGNLNHLGIDQACSRSNLSYLNKHRDWRVFRSLYLALLEHFSPQLGSNRTRLSWLNAKFYALDSTVVSLCLNSFDWARYRRQKGGIKLHTLLDVDTALPELLILTDARKHDGAVAKSVLIPSGSVVVMDRGYFDFDLLAAWERDDIRFVTRNKSNINWQVVQERGADFVLDSKTGLRCELDQLVRPAAKASQAKYPDPMRLVKIYDQQEGYIELLTNQTSWTAEQVAQLYRQRWQVELFFRDIKQHLKIKSFVGTSENAVLIQIWTAMITILMARLLQLKTGANWCLANLIGFIRLHLFAKTDLEKWLNQPFDQALKRSKPWTKQLAIIDG